MKSSSSKNTSVSNAAHIAAGLRQMHAGAIRAVSTQRYDEALALFGQILDFEEKLRWKREAAQTLVNIANVLALLERYDEALESLRKARGRMAASGGGDDQMVIQLAEARVFLAKGQPAEAFRLAEQCVRTGATDPVRGRGCMVCAEVLVRKNEHARAQQYLTKAIDTFERVNDRAALGECLARRADFFSALGRHDWKERDLARLRQLQESEE
jgi:tetratricopeptide (TPR) repeat protein